MTARRAVNDNLAVLELLDRLDHEARPADVDERAVLARWHGWGAAGQLFDRPEFETERARLAELLGPAGYRAAQRTTLNAHYTDARIVRPIWQALATAGVTGGVVLEPGAGRGAFLAEAPEGFRVLAIELDPATARVAQALADPRHAVVQADFAELQLVPATADAVVGNVPFGQYALFDPEHNPGRRLSIHDHFIAKAAAGLRPDGIAVVVTSRYTMDKGDSAARAAIGAHADFIGAVRLPSNAHRTEAGTKVVTDVLILRGRAPDKAPNHAPGWEEPPVEITHWQGEALAEPVRISSYWLDNPDQVLGDLQVGGGIHQSEVVVEGDVTDLEGTLGAALGRVARLVPRAELGPRPAAAPRELLVVDEAAATAGPFGRIERTETGVFRRMGPEGWEPHLPSGNQQTWTPAQRAELGTLIELRNLAEELVALESNHGISDDTADATRARLRGTWESYVSRWGPLNRVRVNDQTGKRSYPQMAGFRTDPGWPRVSALEVHDQVLGTVDPASILTHRVVTTPDVPTRAEDPGDALALSLGQRGIVDVDYIADLLDTSPAAALEVLGKRVFLDPGLGRWVPAEEYLSGNVRAKLRAVEATVADDPSLARNVTALVDVIPRDVTADELAGTLGAPWLGHDVVQAFARSLYPGTNDPERNSITAGYEPTTGSWALKAPGHVRNRMKADHEFGLARFDVLKLLECGLNGRAPVVTIPQPDGPPLVDVDATTQAVELAEDLSERFDTWLLREDSERAAAALGIFNTKFNAHVPRSYELSADAINTEGLRNDFTLRPHQRTAIARMVYGHNALLAHPVGAGKTAEMICGAMSLKRVGTIKRPLFVVPNHMLDQFASDIVGLYPAAQVLTISKNQFNKVGRETFAALVRSHDWDAVVITHNSFTRWPLSPEAETEALEAKLDGYREQLGRLRELKGAANETLTKKLEQRLANYEEKLKEARSAREKRRDAHDFFFDEAGIDWVAVDEAHEFKNAEILSQARSLRGVPTGPAVAKADDLDSKLRWLREAHPDRPVVTFATATPISNTAAELWVMGRYLRPDLLDEVGIGAFDSFRLAFCDTTSAMELDVSGTKFRRIERLARYRNLPELARIWGEFCDTVTVDQLDLPRPALAGGERNVVVVPRSPALAEFMTVELSERADAVRDKKVQPDEDNYLRITTHARIASFDWETYSGEPVDPEYSTLVAAADQIARIYHATKDRNYRTASGGPHPRTGAFQLVFSDLGTPKPARDDTAYDRLRALLVDRDVPAVQVGFVHEHDKDDETKARFFAACRDGRISVAISSTPKMGMGTNVQDRLYALHHIDCPWRPSDIEQREGRIIRQGNQNTEVHIYAYAAEQSFYVSAWQTVERKAGFVGQIMRADPNGPRVLESDDAEALSYGQIKALATGDPDFVRLAEFDDRVARLERIQRGHHQEQAALGRRLSALQEQIDQFQSTLARHGPLATDIANATPDLALPIYVNNQPFDNRADAARAIAPELSQYGETPGVASFGLPSTRRLFMDWQAYESGGGYFRVGSIGVTVQVPNQEHNTLVGAFTRLINQTQGLPDRLRHLEHVVLPDLRAQLARTDAAIGTPPPNSDELRAARIDANTLRNTLEERYADTDDALRVEPVGHDEPIELSAVERLRRRLDRDPARSDPPDLAL